MRAALQLSERGTGMVSPNPRVGCCLVDHDICIAEGAHEVYGGAHAEVNALRALRSPITPTTVAYVTLEPCNHQGKTPPCTEALVASGIRHVVIAIEDPNPIVSGSGIRTLMDAGIHVLLGICADEASWINRFYRQYITTRAPYVLLKTAESSDGFLAPHPMRRLQLTGPESRRLVHRLRAEVDAVLTGISTVLCDDPHLDVRDVPGRNPQRVILDSDGRLPLDSWIAQTAERIPTHVFVSASLPVDNESTLVDCGLHVHRVDELQSGSLDLEAVFRVLGSINIASVLCETGPTLSTSLLRGDYVHEWHRFTSANTLGAGYGIGNHNSDHWRLHSSTLVGSDQYSIVCRSQP